MNNNPMQFLQQQFQALQSNPAQFFSKMRLDIPQNIVNNPDAILQHLSQEKPANSQKSAGKDLVFRIGFLTIYYSA